MYFITIVIIIFMACLLCSCVCGRGGGNDQKGASGDAEKCIPVISLSLFVATASRNSSRQLSVSVTAERVTGSQVVLPRQRPGTLMYQRHDVFCLSNVQLFDTIGCRDGLVGGGGDVVTGTEIEQVTNGRCAKGCCPPDAVSYTHLTLPTRRTV